MCSASGPTIKSAVPWVRKAGAWFHHAFPALVEGYTLCCNSFRKHWKAGAIFRSAFPCLWKVDGSFGNGFPRAFLTDPSFQGRGKIVFPMGSSFRRWQKGVVPADIRFFIRFPNAWKWGAETWSGKNIHGHEGCFLRSLNLTRV